MSPGELRDQIRRPQFRLSDTPAPRYGDKDALASWPDSVSASQTLLSSVLAYLMHPVLLRPRSKLGAAAAPEPPAQTGPAPRGADAGAAQSRPAKPVLLRPILLHWRFQSTTRLVRLPGAPAQERQKTRAPGASSVNSNLGP